MHRVTTLEYENRKRSKMRGGRPEREGVKWRGMGTEIKQRQDTNQHNAMANNTTENKTKEKNKLVSELFFGGFFPSYTCRISLNQAEKRALGACR